MLPSKQAAALMVRTANQLDKSQRAHLEAAAFHAKDIMNDGIAKAGYPKGSTFRGGKVKFRGARYDMKGRTNPVALLRYTPAGPAALWEHGSKAHTIVSKKVGGSAAGRGRLSTGPGMFGGEVIRSVKGSTRTSKIKKRGAVRTPQGMRAYAKHPGQKGHPYWSKVDRQIRDETPKVLFNSMITGITKAGWKKGP